MVMNPFAVDAVFDVVLFTPKRAPIRSSALTDRVLRPGKSVAFRLNAFAEGEAALGRRGRRLARSRGGVLDGDHARRRDPERDRRDGDGIDRPCCRSAAERGSRRSISSFPARSRSTSARRLLSSEAPVPAGGLTEASQNPDVGAALSGDVLRSVVGRRRRAGRMDRSPPRCGAWASATTVERPAARTEPASAWVVLPAIAGEPLGPRIVRGQSREHDRDGDVPCAGAEGDTLPRRRHPHDPAGLAWIRCRRGSSRAMHGSAVEIRSSGGDILALAASTSLGVKGLSTYALAMGVRDP